MISLKALERTGGHITMMKRHNNNIFCYILLLLSLYAGVNFFYGRKQEPLPRQGVIVRINQNQGWEQDDIQSEYEFEYEHVVDRLVDSNTCRSRTDSIPMINLVSNRELYFGCHSFEEYLSPKYETIFIFKKEFVRTWKIDELAETAACNQTLGVHVLMLDNYGGEVLARRIALEYIENEVVRRRRYPGKIEFLNHINCDVHAIPQKDHTLYKPLPYMLEKMVKDFQVVRAQRDPEKYSPTTMLVPDFPLVTNVDEKDSIAKFGILGMTPLLIEELSKNKTDGLIRRIHGVDVCNWKSKGGLAARPNKFKNFPWLCDIQKSTENHMIMFDMEKLLLIKEEYIYVPQSFHLHTFPSDTRLTPRIANRYNLTIVMNRDVFAYQEFSHSPKTVESYPIDFDVDNMRVNSWSLLAETRSPWVAYKAWNGYKDALDLDISIDVTTIELIAKHFKRDASWYPQKLIGQPVIMLQTTTFISALMSIFGYTMQRRCEDYFYYSLKGLYPGNIYVRMTTDVSLPLPEHSWEFMRLKKKNGLIFRYIADASVSSKEMKSMKPKSRIVPVPQYSVVDSLNDFSKILDDKSIQKKGKHIPEEDKKNKILLPCIPKNNASQPSTSYDAACGGYLNSAEFDIPYSDCDHYSQTDGDNHVPADCIDAVFTL